jgi:hypothetical protein
MDIVSKINGNTCSATEFNQIPTELEALQTSSGQTSSDAILNQVSIATSRYAANNFYIDSGTADAYILTLAASMTNPVSATVGYFTGMTIRFRAGNANTGASTVNVNSAGVKNLKQADGTTDLAAGDIPTTQDSVFRYNGTAFVLQIGAASTTAKGIIELLTNAELAAGTDSTRAATAAAIASLFSNSTLTTAGVIYIPVLLGGAFVKLMIQVKQGVSTTTGDSTQTITFPAAFPNAVLACFVSTINTSASTQADAWFQENSKTTSSIAVQAQWSGTGSLSGGVTPQIIAIGY